MIDLVPITAYAFPPHCIAVLTYGLLQFLYFSLIQSNLQSNLGRQAFQIILKAYSNKTS